MTTYKGKQSVNDEALGEFKDYGFELIEPDDHVVELWFKDKRIAVFNQTKVTFDIIRQGCKNFLANYIAHNHDDCYHEELTRGG